MSSVEKMTPAEAIRIVESKASGRTRYEGQQDYVDEVLVAEIKRLQAVVDKLPKDGNGDPVQIGMVYYTAGGHGFNLGVDALGQIIDHLNNEVDETVFLTRELAEAALKEQSDV